jgi:NAD(P)-dependent dehydrogenase (short-subunit alcohol dehydrogenase family)
MEPQHDLRNQAALVTAAGGAMGLATAIGFAESGAAVTLADIHEAAVEGARDQLLATGHQALAVRRDVFDEADLAARVAMTVDTFGRLDAALESYLDIARVEGARAAVGGRRPADGTGARVWGRLFPPTGGRTCSSHRRRSPGRSSRC